MYISSIFNVDSLRNKDFVHVVDEVKTSPHSNNSSYPSGGVMFKELRVGLWGRL